MLRNGLKALGESRWLQKGFWAITDQCLWGASNFVIQIFVARWTSEAAFGAFAIGFSAHILVLTFYNALVVEPMLVFGAGRFQRRFSEYLGTLIHGTFALSVLSGLVVMGGGAALWAAGSGQLAFALLGAGIAIPAMLFSWLMRQACYVHHKPRLAAIGGALYAITVLSGGYVLYQMALLTPFSMFCMMAACRLLAGIALIPRLRPVWFMPRMGRYLRVVLRRHWAYGRWAVASCVPMRLPGHIVLLMLPIWGGLAATGALKAIYNLMMPVLQVISALGVLLIPTLARVRGQQQFFTLTRMMLFVFLLMSVGCWLLLGIFGDPMMDWLYDGRFRGYGVAIWILGFGTVFAGVKEVFAAALRAQEQPKAIFWSHAIAVVAVMPVCVVLIARQGLTGAAIGATLLHVATALGLYLYFRRLKAPKARPAPAAESPAREAGRLIGLQHQGAESR